MANYKVLIPLDGSRLAESSLAYLTHLKQMGDLQVTLISVIDVLRTQLPGFDESREFNVMESYLLEVAGDVHARLSVPVEIKVPSGTPSVFGGLASRV
jgi:nucleotide-binding universal stress UspA family protein